MILSCLPMFEPQKNKTRGSQHESHVSGHTTYSTLCGLLTVRTMNRGKAEACIHKSILDTVAEVVIVRVQQPTANSSPIGHHGRGGHCCSSLFEDADAPGTRDEDFSAKI
jgi:hypothetical protein